MNKEQNHLTSLVIKADALVLHKNGMVFSDISEKHLTEFWIQIGPGLGYIKFERVSSDSQDYLSKSVQLESFPVPSPLVSIQHVLWRRQAAIEAELCISAFRAGLAPWKKGSSTQSDT